MQNNKTVKHDLLQKIRDHSAAVGVVGLGYVGLPFAVEKAKVGFHVIGIDQNSIRVEKINRGENYISDVNDDELRRLVREDLIEASTDFTPLAEADVIVIAVPTPLTRNLTPDLQYVNTVTRKIAELLRPGRLICLESTTYPGTTEEVILPILESSGLKAERDFYLAHSPERADPGNKRYTTKNTSKIVGGVGPESLEAAATFYSQTIERVVPVSSSKAAELVKVFENTFRAVNIALVNELALLCDRLDLNIWEVLDAAGTKPFGMMPFYPGPGVGGHCIPIDPHYLEWKAKDVGFATHFIALAGEINRKMPEFVREKVCRILNKLEIPPSRAKILLLGMAYKKDLADCRESPAIDITRLLRKDGASIVYHDPFVPRVRDREIEMDGQSLTEELLREQDLVIITTDHTGLDYGWVAEHSRHILDTRNATKNVTVNRERITLL